MAQGQENEGGRTVKCHTWKCRRQNYWISELSIIVWQHLKQSNWESQNLWIVGK
jgi:hypothetical protein